MGLVLTRATSPTARLRRAAGRRGRINRNAIRELARDFCAQTPRCLRQSRQFLRIVVCSPGVMPSEFDDPQTYKIIGAAMTVHRELGCGFLEAVSREALTIELRERGIPFVREARLPVHYRDRLLPLFYTKQCLACHGMPKGQVDISGYEKEGFKEGDIGGAISVMIPVENPLLKADTPRR